MPKPTLTRVFQCSRTPERPGHCRPAKSGAGRTALPKRETGVGSQHARRSPNEAQSENDLEQLYAVPFSGIIGIERCVLHPDPVPRRRPWIQHLKRVTTRTKGFRKCSLNSRSLERDRFLNRTDRFLPAKRCPEFLGRSSRYHRSYGYDHHQCLHISLSFEPCAKLRLQISKPKS